MSQTSSRQHPKVLCHFSSHPLFLILPSAFQPLFYLPAPFLKSKSQAHTPLYAQSTGQKPHIPSGPTWAYFLPLTWVRSALYRLDLPYLQSFTAPLYLLPRSLPHLFHRQLLYITHQKKKFAFKIDSIGLVLQPRCEVRGGSADKCGFEGLRYLLGHRLRALLGGLPWGWGVSFGRWNLDRVWEKWR